jgi:hypothetical protein
MKPTRPTRTNAASTWVEVLVIGLVVFLLWLVMHGVGTARDRAYRIRCHGYLKQVGLAARMWSNDNGDKFPWEVSTNQGGTLEYASSAEVYRHFVVISTELVTPYVLKCPSDSRRGRVKRFSSLANGNISYFFGLDANEDRPQSILSGDRNITGGVTQGNWLLFDSNAVPGWDGTIHHHQGNIGLGDGSVQQLTPNSLARQFQSALRSMTNNGPIRLAVPRVSGDEAATDGLVFGIDVPVPLVTAVVIGAGLLVGWRFVRRRLLEVPRENPEP